MNGAVAVFAAAVLLLPCGTETEADNTDTVCRYNFEHATRGVPTDWYPTYTDFLPETREYVIFGWDPDVSHMGTHAISIELAKNFPKLQHSYDHIDYNWLLKPRLQSDTIYRISFWWKARETGARGFVHIRGDDVPETGGVPTFVVHKPPLATTDELVYDGSGWQQYVIDVKTPKRLKYFEVRLGLSAPRGVGHKIWFDDFEIDVSPRQNAQRPAASN